jgi:hypothetical protein
MTDRQMCSGDPVVAAQAASSSNSASGASLARVVITAPIVVGCGSPVEKMADNVL